MSQLTTTRLKALANRKELLLGTVYELLVMGQKPKETWIRQLMKRKPQLKLLNLLVARPSRLNQLIVIFQKRKRPKYLSLPAVHPKKLTSPHQCLPRRMRFISMIYLSLKMLNLQSLLSKNLSKVFSVRPLPLSKSNRCWTGGKNQSTRWTKRRILQFTKFFNSEKHSRSLTIPIRFLCLSVLQIHEISVSNRRRICTSAS
mmetsp:Transcript_8354/g.17209  ORF Transcript_8354/g.17209 Transcript_8354/m.17209 type:complete len:201 (-) Transcript_8354:1113-1715(-)